MGDDAMEAAAVADADAAADGATATFASDFSSCGSAPGDASRLRFVREDRVAGVGMTGRAENAAVDAVVAGDAEREGAAKAEAEAPVDANAAAVDDDELAVAAVGAAAAAAAARRAAAARVSMLPASRRCESARQLEERRGEQRCGDAMWSGWLKAKGRVQ